MNRRLERLVRARAKGLCEYCRILEAHSELVFVIDHVIAIQHHGRTHETNLALSCVFCNRHKGPNVGGVDPRTGRHTRLFHPRKDRWTDHFKWKSEMLMGKTALGRTTIVVLAMNHENQLRARRALMREGLFDPR